MITTGDACTNYFAFSTHPLKKTRPQQEHQNKHGSDFNNQTCLRRTCPSHTVAIVHSQVPKQKMPSRRTKSKLKPPTSPAV